MTDVPPSPAPGEEALREAVATFLRRWDAFQAEPIARSSDVDACKVSVERLRSLAAAPAREPAGDVLAGLPQVAESCPACEDDGGPCAVCKPAPAREPAREPGEPGRGAFEHGVTVWVCPDCAFAFDAGHTDADGGYSCPACYELALRSAPAREGGTPEPSEEEVFQMIYAAACAYEVSGNVESLRQLAKRLRSRPGEQGGGA